MQYLAWTIDGVPTGALQKILQGSIACSLRAISAACDGEDEHSSEVARMVAANLFAVSTLSLDERQFTDEVQQTLNLAHDVRKRNLSVVYSS